MTDQSKLTIPESRVRIDDILSESHTQCVFLVTWWMTAMGLRGSIWSFSSIISAWLESFSFCSHRYAKSQSDACSFIQPAGWIQIPLRHSRETQKVTIFSGNDHHTLSLPQDEQCHYMLAEWALSESVIHSVMLALSVLCKPTSNAHPFLLLLVQMLLENSCLTW